MKNDRKTTVTFTATLKGRSSSGLAVKLLNCKQGKEELFHQLYIPISGLEDLHFVNKKKEEVSITIDDWLYQRKLEEYIEDQKKYSKINALIDQGNFQLANTNSKSPSRKKIDRLVDELAEKPNK
jgi:hypothetical protein